jgi:hypothetical protein
MKNKSRKNNSRKVAEEDPISRKTAMKRLGLSAFSAATMLILLNNPAKAQDGDSPADPPYWE